MQTHFALLDVVVYQLEVRRQLKHWREQDQRASRWFSAPQAMERLDEPGLKTILLELIRKRSVAA